MTGSADDADRSTDETSIAELSLNDTDNGHTSTTPIDLTTPINTTPTPLTPCCTAHPTIVFRPADPVTTPLCSVFNKYGTCKRYDLQQCRYLHVNEEDTAKWNTLKRRQIPKVATVQRTTPLPDGVRPTNPINQPVYKLFNLAFGEERTYSLLRRTLELNAMLAWSTLQQQGVVAPPVALYWGKSIPTKVKVHTPLRADCRILHVSRSVQLTHKDRLLRCIRHARLQSATPSIYDFLVDSYLLPMESDLVIDHHRRLCGYSSADEWAAQPRCEAAMWEGHKRSQCTHVTSLPSGADPLWILKPYAKGEGHGIVITDLQHTYADIDLRNRRQLDVPHQLKQLAVCSRYIEPLLINQRKFDLRLYVAVMSSRLYPQPRSTRYDPPSQFCTSKQHPTIWLYTDGLVRFASLPYNTDDLTNRYQHLTNNHINQPSHVKLTKQGSNEASDIDHSSLKRTQPNWNVAQLAQHLQTHHNVQDFQQQVWSLIQNTVVHSICAADEFYTEFTRPANAYNFELLGYDIMFDAEMNAKLLEVNSAPTLTDAGINHKRKHAVHYDVKSKMLAGLLTMLQLPMHNSTVPNGSSSGDADSLYTGTQTSEHSSDCVHQQTEIGGWQRLY